MKILMVCLGNICRSPLADALLRKKVDELGLNIEVDSAGTSDYHIGGEPDKRTQENALNHGLDMSFLRARQFTKKDFDTFDLIYVMDKSNESNVLSLTTNSNHKDKVKLILDLLDDTKYNEVPDPYYGGEQGFETVYTILDQATNKILEEISIQKQ
ncbi:low molecular weight phosphotyrosine protein phosphatase [Crocinitomicaceae bacterium]|nr:low molecular weight phosphotyrosine protein phosphatase [Crocinitomicaceae bacterium]MDG2464744.1 low molecular weight phosphotyrosine protein phosphatase [Crocinitomicaceae bacterium]